jgi:lipopolysaccharide export system protein LptC
MKARNTQLGRQWLGRAWDHLSIYLPVLSMGLLALGSYWVLRSAPPPPAPTIERPARHEPDYFMRRFSVRDFDTQGQLKSEVAGQELRHYPDDGSMEVDRVRLRSFKPNGPVTYAEAELLTTDAGQHTYVLEKDVRVTRDAQDSSGKGQPRVTFQGEQLRVLVDAERIESDRPVVMTHGQDRITANSLRYDDGLQIADLQGNVRATLAPRQ